MKRLLLLISGLLFANHTIAQFNVKITVSEVQTLQSNDCDGFLLGNSDFVWEYEATDNTLLYTSEGEGLADRHYTFENNNGGPYTLNPNEEFFNQDYYCPSIIPSDLIITWEAYENDDALNWDGAASPGGKDGSTGNQTANVPATLGVNSYTYTAASIGGCNQTFEITFSVEITAISIMFIEDAICDAPQQNVGQTLDYAWCGSNNFEPNEEWKTDEEISGSGWIMFRAPNSGTVNIDTDFGETDFGTEYYVYHAADGFNCGNGNALDGTQIKNKFDYLSFVSSADDDIPVFSPEGKASQDFSNAVFALGKPLVPNEVYYIQVGTDDAGQFGNIRVRISDLNETGAQVQDIPCQAPLQAFGTTEISDANGDAPSFSLDKSRCYDLESDAGDNDVNLAAYDLDEVLSGGNDVNGTAWFKFVAPCSGRISIEANLNASGEAFYLLKADERFGPGIPSDYQCKDLVIPNNDYTTYYVDGGIGSTAVRDFDCLEPGYEYYVSLDPDQVNIASEFDVWIYDPGPAVGQPGNDVLCQALENPSYEIPVDFVDDNINVGATPGSYAGACFEELAGEPHSDSNPADRADQTVWHYFYAPASGSIEIIVNASEPVNWSIFESFDGTTAGCYGGLAANSPSCPPALPGVGNGRTFTEDGTQNTTQITPLLSQVSTGSGLDLCCLTEGDLYVIQIDGADATNSNQLYTIEINELEVFAGNTQLEDVNANISNAVNGDTAFICYNTSIQASALNTNTPSCIDVGFILHNSMNPTPDANVSDSVELQSVTIFNSTYNSGDDFANDGSIAAAPFNTVMYISAMADNAANWGDICPSADVEDAVPVVFLEELQVTNVAVDGVNCVPLQDNVFVTVQGGLPDYDGSDYSYEIALNGVSLFAGTATVGSTIDFFAPVQAIYELVLTDDLGCTQSFNIDATGVLCNDFCLLFNDITSNPLALVPDAYECDPATYTAALNFGITGGAPEFFPLEDYTVNITINSVTTTSNTDTVSLVLNNGDVWSIEVYDDQNCDTLTVGDTFNFDATDCGHLCEDSPLTTEDQPLGFEYECLTTNVSQVSIVAQGGFPTYIASSYFITVTGSSVAGANVTNQAFNNGIEHIFLVNAGDDWNVSVTDTFGCGPVLLSDDLPEVYTFAAQSATTSCDGTDLFGELSGSDVGVSYRLFRDGNPTNITLVGTGAALVFGPITSNGLYTVETFTINQCREQMTGEIEFLFSTGLDVSIDDAVNVTCAGEDNGSIDVIVVGGVAPYSFTWTDATNTVISTDEDLENLGGGIYQVLVEDAYGCLDSISATLTEPALAFSVDTLSLEDVSCAGQNDGEVVLQTTGGQAIFSYSIDGLTYQVSNTFSNLPAGFYSFFAQDDNGCVASVSATIDENPPVEIVLSSISEPSCGGVADGAADVTVSGGSGVYTFDWSNNTANEDLTNVEAGTYILTVTDDAGCDATLSVTISGPQVLATSMSVTNPSCFGEETGEAQVSVFGGSTGYTFSWNTTPVQTGATANNLAGDTQYIVTITDANGCSTMDTAQLTNPAAMTVDAVGVATNCISAANGSVNVGVNGGNAPYNYQLNGLQQQDSIFENLNAGTYIVFVEDNNNCVASTEFDITGVSGTEAELQGAGGNGVFVTDDLFIVRGEDVALQVEVLNTTGNDITGYVWSPVEANDTTNCGGDCDNISLSPIDDVTIVVEIQEDIDGSICSIFDTLTINVSQETMAFMPNAFSPNGDGLNDYFEINILGAESSAVRIFNRWGEEVFYNEAQANGEDNPDASIPHYNNPRNAWDGTFNGEFVPQGTYVYQIDVTYFNGEQEYLSGTVTVIR